MVVLSYWVKEGTKKALICHPVLLCKGRHKEIRSSYLVGTKKDMLVLLFCLVVAIIFIVSTYYLMNF